MQEALSKTHSLELEKAKATYQEILTSRNQALVSMTDKLFDARQQLQAVHQHVQEAEREKDQALAALTKEKVSLSARDMWS